MDIPLLRVQSTYDLPKLKLLPLREQPAYRVAQNADACNLAELLAAIVGGPMQIETAESLLAKFGSISRLHQAHLACEAKLRLSELLRSSPEIASVKGIGQQTAVRLKAALALARKALQEEAEERPIIGSPAEAAAVVMYEMALLGQEQLRVLLLDTRNRLMEVVTLYQGSVNSTQVRVAEVFKPAVQRNAPGMIGGKEHRSHNHPSGDPAPSPDDVALTRAITEAGKLLDVEVIDHLIIGKGSNAFVSLKEQGLGFSS